jgi:hypothetical protein
MVEQILANLGRRSTLDGRPSATARSMLMRRRMGIQYARRSCLYQGARSNLLRVKENWGDKLCVMNGKRYDYRLHLYCCALVQLFQV